MAEFVTYSYTGNFFPNGTDYLIADIFFTRTDTFPFNANGGFTGSLSISLSDPYFISATLSGTSGVGSALLSGSGPACVSCMTAQEFDPASYITLTNGLITDWHLFGIDNAGCCQTGAFLSTSPTLDTAQLGSLSFSIADNPGHWINPVPGDPLWEPDCQQSRPYCYSHAWLAP
jgi:hypothetical protein